MTTLAQKIAREHEVMAAFDAPYRYRCTCGKEIFVDPNDGQLVVDFAEHIATVTEAAVVERATLALRRMSINGPMLAIFPEPAYRELLASLALLMAQEIQAAEHYIARGGAS